VTAVLGERLVIVDRDGVINEDSGEFINRSSGGRSQTTSSDQLIEQAARRRGHQSVRWAASTMKTSPIHDMRVRVRPPGRAGRCLLPALADAIAVPQARPGMFALERELGVSVRGAPASAIG
jgi:hypothetical protein